MRVICNVITRRAPLTAVLQSVPSRAGVSYRPRLTRRPDLPDQLTRVGVSSRLYRSRPVPAAYYVDGYQKARAFIVTERPTAGACDAVWRLAWEQGVTGLVVIGTLEVRAGRQRRGGVHPLRNLGLLKHSLCDKYLTSLIVRFL